MTIKKVCSSCGVPIYFKRNSTGKYVPFNIFDDRCHYETCNLKPKSSFNKIRSKIPYDEQIKNHRLDKYIG